VLEVLKMNDRRLEPLKQLAKGRAEKRVVVKKPKSRGLSIVIDNLDDLKTVPMVFANREFAGPRLCHTGQDCQLMATGL
jgi:hypothetical protein